MALTPEQKSSRLFKKLFGKAETLTSRDFFEESKDGKTFIFPSQIWTDESSIPTTAPVLSDGQTSGVVKYFEKLTLSHIAGSQNRSYFHENLKDTIPFNFGDGTYNYAIYKSNGTTQIAFGEGDWLLDVEGGVLTFYGTLPSGVDANNPPKISFYKYVGNKGFVNGGSSSFIIKDPVLLSTTETDVLSNYDTDLSGFTSLPATIDGILTDALSEGNRILVKDQVDKVQNGIFQISGTTLVRASDSDGSTGSEVSVGNYTYVNSGNTNSSSSWYLNSTDAEDPLVIIPGVNTQIWKFFSKSTKYTAEQAIIIENNVIKLSLDESGIGSGLEQGVDGLRVTRELIETITGITSLESAINNIDMSSIEGLISLEESSRVAADSSLDTRISTEESSRTSADSSLETAINTIDMSSIEGLISLEESSRIAADSSLDTRISIEESVRTVGDESLTTRISEEESIRLYSDQSLETAINTIDMSSIEGLISLEESSRVAADSSLDTRISTEESVRTAADNSLDTRISTEESSRTSADASLETLISEEIATHKHSALYNPSLSGDPIVFVDSGDNVHINANIYQQGSIYETHAEQIYTTKDYIFLRSGATAGLNPGEFAGFQAIKYDGTNDGRLVFDSGGTARVGDVGDEQPLTTRPESENITDGHFAYWDEDNNRLDFMEIDTDLIGVIGTPDDPSGYSDGLFPDFTSGTTIANAIDKFNEVLLKLAPTPPSDWSTSTLTIGSTTFTARQLTTGLSTPTNSIVDTTTPLFNVTIPTQGLSDAENGSLSFDIDGATAQEVYNVTGTTSKTTGVIRYTSGDPYIGQVGKAGFWFAFKTASAVSQTLTASSDLKTANYTHSTKGNLSRQFYLDYTRTVTIGAISATVPSMTNYISGVPTLTTSDTITNISFNINNVSSYFYAPTYVWEIQQNLVAQKTGDPDNIPTTFEETGSVTNQTATIRTSQFSDTSFTFQARGRNSRSINGSSTTFTDTSSRVDTTSVETIRRTSGSGSYPASGWGGTYDSSESLLLNEELQLKNGIFQYPTVNYTTQGGPDYSSISSGIRWVTFTTGGTFTNNSAFTLNFIDSNGITNIIQTGLYVEVKISGATFWVDGNANYDGVSDPGSTSDGDAAVVNASSTATARRITFGSVTYTGAIVVRIGIAHGSSINFKNITITNIV